MDSNINFISGINPEAPSAAPGLSVSPAQAGNRAAQPCLVRRRDIHPDVARLPLLGGDHGLGDP